MKIAFLVDEFPCLSQTFVLNQVQGIAHLGADVDVLALAKGKLSNEAESELNCSGNINVIYLTKNFKKNRLIKRSLFLLKPFFSKPILLLKSLKSIFGNYGIQGKSLLLSEIIVSLNSKADYDVIICHFAHNGFLAEKLRRLKILEGKIITFFHGYDVSSKAYQLQNQKNYRSLFQNGDVFLPISNLWHDELISKGATPQKVHTHRMGIELNKFKFSPRTYNPGKKFKLFSVGRLCEKKGHEYLIKAFALLPNRHQFSIEIAGTGELADKLKSLIIELGLEDEVKLLGATSHNQVIKKLYECNLFILPSITAKNGDMEGIPVALMEAMAIGRLCISTKHSGIPELITENKEGLLVKEKDINGLRDSILWAFNNLDQVGEIIINARHKVDNIADIQKLNESLLNRIVSLITINKF
ncbi:glycosyltransferase [Catenovulum sp. SM1970]|uniref:glycosyltransferase n=1 Tax=Marinifaba aquimaris TaxID=2741323 RepID=UPI00157190EF|nr:glycosyltransferase [Marinifaba aquimaris]NTS76908.1 glycosyltransferase [Marinifaba aquimaris]